MIRREFVLFLGGSILGGSIAAWALDARGQDSNPKVRRIGMIVGMDDDPEAQIRVKAFERQLRELGWIEGRNVRIDIRWPGADLDRIRSAAAELVALAPDVIVATGTPVAIALQDATRAIPIVFALLNDAVGRELVSDFGRPRSNLTGLTNYEFSMGGKWLEILKEIAPRTARVGLIFDPTTSTKPRQFYGPSVDAVGRSLGVEVIDAAVRDQFGIEQALDGLAREPNAGVIVLPDSTTVRYRTLVTASAAKRGLPAIYPYRYFVTNGGLVSYGVDTVDLYRRAALYVDRILRGAKPADLPVQRPTKFELVINLKTAKALSLDLPPTLLARADEVRE